MAARLLRPKPPPIRVPVRWSRLGPSAFSGNQFCRELLSSFSSSTMQSTPKYADRWSPPPEPEKPAVPYRTGYRFTARRVKTPPPFLGRYNKLPSPPFRDFLKKSRLLGRAFLQSSTMVDYCLSAAATPLPCEELQELADFEVLEELAVGDGLARGCGSQVFLCTRQGHKEPLVAKVYDPLYYPFADDDFPDIPNNVVARAEYDFCVESAAYTQLDQRLGGGLIPKFHGSWVVNVPLKHRSRPVSFILMEQVKGVQLSTLDPKIYTQEERLHMLSLCMEAEIEMHFSGVIHEDMAPRNVICSGTDLLADNLTVRIIDLGVVSILPLLGGEAPCESEPLPMSPIEWFWNGWPVDMRDWVPDECEKGPEWQQWLKERWDGSPKFKPPVQENLRDISKLTWDS